MIDCYFICLSDPKYATTCIFVLYPWFLIGLSGRQRACEFRFHVRLVLYLNNGLKMIIHMKKKKMKITTWEKILRPPLNTETDLIICTFQCLSKHIYIYICTLISICNWPNEIGQVVILCLRRFIRPGRETKRRQPLTGENRKENSWNARSQMVGSHLYKGNRRGRPRKRFWF